MTPSGGDKPYRVYRGGRIKGKVPTLTREGREAVPGGGGRFGLRKPKRPERKPERGARTGKRRWGRWLSTSIGVFVLLVIIWSIAGYFSFRSGVQAANKRLPKKAKHALTHQGGLLMSKSTNILLLGTDHSSNKSRAGDQHSDSIMLIHTDPGRHRLIYTSIMRDLEVEVPGYGTQKVNAGYQFGGPALEIATIKGAFGLPVNHVVLVDFNRFRDLIDSIGGISVNNPQRILSNKFDCPYNAQKCVSWKGWRFHKGTLHLDGRKALIYSRIRENQLDPSETDATRVIRQQQVMQAIASKLTNPSTFMRLPFVGGDLLKPVATDLSAAQLMQLGWVKFRAGKPWRCRLGLDSDPGPRELVILFMQSRRAAPQPPQSPLGSGCVHGDWPRKTH